MLTDDLSIPLAPRSVLPELNPQSQLDRDFSLASAAAYGHLDVVKFLLEQGANVEHQNSLGKISLLS